MIRFSGKSAFFQLWLSTAMLGHEPRLPQIVPEGKKKRPIPFEKIGPLQMFNTDLSFFFQMVEMFVFLAIFVIFLFGYGVATQALLYSDRLGELSRTSTTCLISKSMESFSLK